MTMDAFRRATLLPLMMVAVGSFTFVLRAAREHREETGSNRSIEARESLGAERAANLLEAESPSTVSRHEESDGVVNTVSEAPRTQEPQLSEARSREEVGSNNRTPGLAVGAPRLERSQTGAWTRGNATSAEASDGITTEVVGAALAAGGIQVAPASINEARVMPTTIPAWSQSAAIVAEAERDVQAELEPLSAARPELELESLRAHVKGRVPQPAVALSPALLERMQQDLAMAQGLARKGAMFSAEKAVAQVLAELGRALDATGPYQDHERCLMAGLTAISEASDFHRTVPGSTGVDWVRLVAGRHQTYVAAVRDAERMDRDSALQHYYAMGLDLLVAGAGSQPLAAQAFVSLGKIHSIAEGAQEHGFGSFAGAPPVPKSLLFHQAALAVNPADAVAANELGVSLGRLGFWRESRDVLVMSVRTGATPEAWRNLAEAHERLGENSYAQMARREAERMVGHDGAELPRLLAPAEQAAPAPVRGSSETARTAGVPFFSGVR